MALIQTRRGFLGGIAAAGAAGVISTPRVRAVEAPLETTTVRLGYSLRPVMRRSTPPPIYCAPKASPMFALSPRRLDAPA
jgi:hypothetical protein